MKATILVPDKRVTVDGRAKVLSDFDWSPFSAVHAVQADLDRDRAEIEFATIDPDGDGPLPAVKPPNELVDRVAFIGKFGPVLDAYVNAPDAPDAPDPTPGPPRSAGSDLEARVAALERRVAMYQEAFERLYGVLPQEGP